MKWGAIILLIALVATASTNVLAECGWILWFDSTITVRENSFPTEWEVVGSAKTYEQCTELQENLLAAHLKRFNSPNDQLPDAPKSETHRVGSRLISIVKGITTEVRYSCWPENRDPRR
jgi:hypothetical protein